MQIEQLKHISKWRPFSKMAAILKTSQNLDLGSKFEMALYHILFITTKSNKPENLTLLTESEQFGLKSAHNRLTINDEVQKSIVVKES